MEHNRKEPQEYLYKTIEVKKGGATFLVNLYLPTTGTGSLKSRLLRLMEQDLERQGNQTEKYTLLYGRLSNEDKREGTSLSIQHQEEMLRDYAAKQGFCNPLFLYDDGVSGTKTNRPGFQRVLAMIREGQAATLIVTDLTRLYRNQSEANNLLEIVFPALGVRFIAITNNYDSATNTESDEDLAMFSNLFNEWYPRQTSRKINAVIQHKAEKGVRIASIPPPTATRKTRRTDSKSFQTRRRRNRCGISPACALRAWGRSRLQSVYNGKEYLCPQNTPTASLGGAIPAATRIFPIGGREAA